MYYFADKIGGHVFRTDSPQHWRGENYTELTKAEGARQYRAQAIAELRACLKPGDTVYCVLRNVSRSGMSRRISLLIVEDGKLRDISHTASVAMNWRKNDRDNSLIVGGCGMDMGFHTVYTLARTVFRDDESAKKDAGYMLRSEWV